MHTVFCLAVCVRREDADALIKRHGGRVTGSVTGKSSFLLVRVPAANAARASLMFFRMAMPFQVGADCGNSKYNKAKELKTPLIDEEGLFALILASAPFAAAPASVAPPAPQAAAPAPVAPVARAPPPQPVAGHAFGAGPSRPPAGAAPSRCKARIVEAD